MRCGNNFTQPNGYIVSPGHPNNYPPYADCDYRIVADSEAFVSIQFLSFDLEGKDRDSVSLAKLKHDAMITCIMRID